MAATARIETPFACTLIVTEKNWQAMEKMGSRVRNAAHKVRDTIGATPTVKKAKKKTLAGNRSR